MQPDRVGNIEYGTFLEFRMKGEDRIMREEFWGIDHSARAQGYMLESDLKEKIDMHRFGSLHKTVK